MRLLRTDPPPPPPELPGGGRAEALLFDVLGSDSRHWQELNSSYSMKSIFEQQQRQYGHYCYEATEESGGGGGGNGHLDRSHGWPWTHCGSWQHALEGHLEPWLMMKEEYRGGDQSLSTARSLLPPATDSSTPSSSHVHVCNSSYGLNRTPPSHVRLFPSIDPLAVTSDDRKAFAAFGAAAGLPPLACDACSDIGLTMSHLITLPTPIIISVSKIAGLSAGSRLRLRRAIGDQFGEALGPTPTHVQRIQSSPRTASARLSAEFSGARRRVRRFAHGTRYIITLSPLPTYTYLPTASCSDSWLLLYRRECDRDRQL